MIQGLRKKFSSIERATKRWLSFITVSFILSILIYDIFLIKLESQSALSVLGTLAQSNATILAIVISLSLVVIEFSASKYSARIVDFIRDDPILREILLLYFFSIFYPVYLMTLINGETVSSNFELYFSAAYALSIISYFSLFYYILYVFKMIKSSSVIDIFSEKIDIKTLSNSSKKIGESTSRVPKDEPRNNRIIIGINDEYDPLLPIIDIIQNSVMQHDYHTAEHGLEAIRYRLLNILIQNPSEEKQISGHVFNRFLEIWDLALRDKDIKLINMVLFEYYYIGEKCTYLVGKPDSTYINFISKLKTKALIPLYRTLNIFHVEEKVKQNNLLYTTFLSEYYIKEAFKSIVELNEGEFKDISISLAHKINKIASKTFENSYELRNNEIEILESLDGFMSELSGILGEIGIAAVNAGSKSALHHIIGTFNYVGEAAIYHNLIYSTRHILEDLEAVGEESAKKGEEFEPLTKQIVKYLENLASKIDTHSEELAGETQNRAIEYYEHIKQKYEYKRTEYALEELNDRVERDIKDIYSYIAMIGEESIKNSLLDATLQSLKSLETVERILQDDTESRRICEMIKNIGLEAVKKEQTFPLMEDIIKSLYSISLLQFGYMFDWERDPKRQREFLKKECSSYSDFEETVSFEYINDREKILTINGKERRDIKCIYLSDIEDVIFEDNTLKLFKSGVFKNSEKAYYKIPELLKELINPILDYALNSPSDETIKPFTMIIQCFENFGILSIHFRDEFSLNKIFISSLVAIGNSFDNIKYSKYDKDNKAWEYLDWVITVVSDSIYKLAIESLTHNFVDSDTLRLQAKCLINIQKKYHNLIFDVEDKFERLLEMIKESELEKSKRDEIVKLIEDAIQEFKNEKVASNGEQLDLHQKEEQSST